MGTRISHILTFFIVTAGTSLHADLTYVDASITNTTLADGTAMVDGSIGYETGTDSTDNLWDLRAFGNGGTIFQGGIGENAPRLATEITGLTPGQTYEIHAYFWGAGTGALWRGRASLAEEAGDLPGYNTNQIDGSSFSPMSYVTKHDNGGNNPGPLSTANASGIENGGHFSNSVLTEEDDRNLYQVTIGQVIVDSTGSVLVYIDDLANTNQESRTWYDGVAYELIMAPVGNAVTYIDADTDNTTRWDGTPFAPAPEGTSIADDNWELRTFGNGGSVYESNADGQEDAPLLVTTLDGLEPNTEYLIYAYFWHDGRDWRLKASANVSEVDDQQTPGDLTDDFLPGDPRTYFTSNGTAGSLATQAGLASVTTFNSPEPIVTESNRTLRQAALGKAMSSSSGHLEVFIDDVPFGEGFRTWYDGVGYQSVQSLVSGDDADGDGLSNGDEETAGSDPYRVDSDGDCYLDGDEVTLGSDPLDPRSVPPVPGAAIAIAPDGVWTWFNDERAIFHQGSLFSGYVRSNGEYCVTRYDPATNTRHHMTISTSNSYQKDDHNNPSITVLPDGRLMVLYAKHLGGGQFYQRTSNIALPSSEADWGPEISNPLTDNNTYNNTYLLSDESDRLYNYHRNINFNPTISYSDDLGSTWNSVPFIEVGTGGVRPYPRYCSNHTNRVDLIYTDGHPRDESNSVYHIYYESDPSGTPGAGSFYKTDGTFVESFANLPLDHEGGQKGSVIYPFSSTSWSTDEGPDDWIPNARGWTWDIHYGKDGNPVCVFQVQLGSDGGGYANSRIWYYYARWNGSQWNRKVIAKAGRGIYSAESDYGGGMTIDPENPNVVYISSNAASPFQGLDKDNIYDITLNPNARYELYRGVTDDGGQTFTWEAITENSDADNLRPIVPENHGYDRALVWFYGSYSSYTTYDCQVLALLENNIEIGSYTFTSDSATIGWISSPGRNYSIRATDELASGFTLDAATGIHSTGSYTEHAFSIPTPLISSDRGFFMVEEAE